MSRPWNKGTKFPLTLQPNILGQFDSHADWVNHASRALTGEELENWKGESIAICIDAKGRRCLNGRDFMRARDEDAFPVRYFMNCEPQPNYTVDALQVDLLDALDAVENDINRLDADTLKDLLLRCHMAVAGKS